MRISDWSSDVCSSDLFLNGRLGAETAHDLFLALDQGGMCPPHLQPGLLEAVGMLLHVLEPEDTTPFLRNMVKGRFRHEIGRASGRERVYQYGEISVVDV